MGRECLGVYGSSDYQTPRLDWMASQGVRFDNMFSQPLCTPSRVKIMTGKHNFRNYTDFGYLNPDETTFGNILRDAGYATMIAGKWQLNGIYRDKKQGWNSKDRPYHFGFDEYCLWQVTVSGSDGERYADPLIIQNGKVLPRDKNAYGPDIFSNYVLDFIDRKKDDDKPFFIYYPMVLVHNPFVPTPDSPEWKDSTRRYEDKDHYFNDMVTYTDEIVGKILDKLERTGLAKNTLVLFMGDNGTNVRIHSKLNSGDVVDGRKGYMVDWGIRVPMIAFWKERSPKGAINTDMVDFADVLPTLTDAAGIHVPPTIKIDGRSFLPQVIGEPMYASPYVYMYYKPDWGKFENGVFARDKIYKLYGDGRFYNVEKDLKEQHPFPLESLSKRMLDIRKKLQNVLDQYPEINE